MSFLFVDLCVCLSILLSVCCPVRLTPSRRPSRRARPALCAARLSVYPAVCLSSCPSDLPSSLQACSACASCCPSVCLSCCLSVVLSVSPPVIPPGVLGLRFVLPVCLSILLSVCCPVRLTSRRPSRRAWPAFRAARLPPGDGNPWRWWRGDDAGAAAARPAADPQDGRHAVPRARLRHPRPEDLLPHARGLLPAGSACRHHTRPGKDRGVTLFSYGWFNNI